MFANIILFISVLLIYLHLIYEWKIYDEIELFETDYTDYYEFLSVCRMKRPFVCEYYSKNAELFNMELSILDDINVYDTNDETMCIKSSYNTFHSLLDKGEFYTQHNHQSIVTSELYNVFKENDELVQPVSNIQSTYDLYMGSDGVTTTLQHHRNSSLFLINIKGSQTIRLFPWSSIKEQSTDLMHYQFNSEYDGWNSSERNMIEIELQIGQLLYIPSYWWYTIRHNKQSHMLSTTYVSLINSITHAPLKLQSIIQQYNILQTYSVVKQNEKNSHNNSTITFQEEVECSTNDHDKSNQGNYHDNSTITCQEQTEPAIRNTVRQVIDEIVDVVDNTNV